MQVIVTRPQQDALRWVEALQARGMRAEALPLIDILPATDGEPLRQAWHRFAAYRAAMFVSGNAVQHFYASKPAPAQIDQARPAINTRAWATGPGTLAALHQAGVAPALIDAPATSSGQFDSEALWRIVGPGVGAGSRILIVRGGAPGGEGLGRNWFAQQLETVGALVDFVVAYERHPPRWTAAQAARAQAAAQDGSVWLLSSSEAIAHLRQRLPASALEGARAVATHPRIAQAAYEAGFGVVCESRPTLDDVMASIESLG